MLPDLHVAIPKCARYDLHAFTGFRILHPKQVFGQQVALSNAGIASLLAVAMVGSVLFQFPLGKLSDMVDRRYVMAGAGIVGLLFGTALTVLTNTGNFGVLFYVCVLVYGGMIYSVYSLAVAHGNDHADPGDFVKTSSGLLILYGFGTMAGPLMTAQLMTAFGPSGVFTSTSIAHLAISIYAVYRTFVSSRVVERKRQDFRSTATARAQTPESYVLDPRSGANAYVLEEEDDLPPMPPPVRVDL